MALPCGSCAAWDCVTRSQGSSSSQVLGNTSLKLQQWPVEEAWPGAGLHPHEKMMISLILVWSKSALTDYFAK